MSSLFSAFTRASAALRLRQLHLAAVFLTRLPLPSLGQQPLPPLSDCMWAFPLVGALVGGGQAIVLAGCWALGLSAGVCAVLALAAGVLITGALHEDGLADMADGFGGGQDRDSVLRILRDSRLGSYGAVALILLLAVKALALDAALTHQSLTAIALQLVAAAMMGRAACVVLACALPLARSDGLAAQAGRPPHSQAVVALAFAVPTACAVWPAATSAAALTGMAVVLWSLRRLALRKIGGGTGDIYGAAAALGEAIGWGLLSGSGR